MTSAVKRKVFLNLTKRGEVKNTLTLLTMGTGVNITYTRPSYLGPSLIWTSYEWALTKEAEMDPHWRPLYASCPFCQLNFTVLARLEDMAEDTAYFLLRSDLASRLVG